MFVIVWEFTVSPEQRAEFARAYGPEGDWAHLFARCDGYVSTELLRDAELPDRCLTLDYWRLPDQYVAGTIILAAAPCSVRSRARPRSGPLTLIAVARLSAVMQSRAMTCTRL